MAIVKGRGSLSNHESRFLQLHREQAHDDWDIAEDPLPPSNTVVTPQSAKSILSKNDSPDIPFDAAINPYLGCEHGCIYCYARPVHAYWGLSPGLDFETRIFSKPNAAELLAKALSAKGYVPTPINLGASTDPYQPAEATARITRSVLEVLDQFHHPVAIVTKGSLLLRDLDLLASMARRQLAAVYVSLTTLDNALKRTLEPRAAGPGARLQMIRALRDAGVPVGVNVSPLIPFINDHELEHILEAAHAAGAQRASTILVRLPREVAPLFAEWLEAHYPDRAERVMHAIQSAHGGQDYRADWGTRFTGTGPIAQLLRQRFHLACKRLGLETGERLPLSTAAFAVPMAPKPGPVQSSLF